MKTSKFLTLFSSLVLIVFFVSCSKDKVEEEVPPAAFANVFSFKINDEPFIFTDLTVSTQNAGSDLRLLVSAKKGDDIYNIRLALDKEIGEYVLDYNLNDYVFAEYNGLGYYTLEEGNNKITITKNDKEEKILEATFYGLGTKYTHEESINITEGVLKVKY